MNGWVKLHRQILDNPTLTRDSDYFLLFCWLLLNATHQPYRSVFRGETITLQPGQLICGRREISRETGLSESKVYRGQVRFRKQDMIRTSSSNQNTLVTIVHWDEYQQTEQPLNSHWTATEHIQEGQEQGEISTGEHEQHDELRQWLAKNYPNVASLKTLPRQDQLTFLREQYSYQAVIDVLNAMENKKDLAKRYKSVYLTALEWLKRRHGPPSYNTKNSTETPKTRDLR